MNLKEAYTYQSKLKNTIEEILYKFDKSTFCEVTQTVDKSAGGKTIDTNVISKPKQYDVSKYPEMIKTLVYEYRKLSQAVALAKYNEDVMMDSDKQCAKLFMDVGTMLVKVSQLTDEESVSFSEDYKYVGTERDSYSVKNTTVSKVLIDTVEAEKDGELLKSFSYNMSNSIEKHTYLAEVAYEPPFSVTYSTEQILKKYCSI